VKFTSRFPERRHLTGKKAAVATNQPKKQGQGRTETGRNGPGGRSREKYWNHFARGRKEGKAFSVNALQQQKGGSWSIYMTLCPLETEPGAAKQNRGKDKRRRLRLIRPGTGKGQEKAQEGNARCRRWVAKSDYGREKAKSQIVEKQLGKRDRKSKNSQGTMRWREPEDVFQRKTTT